MSSVIGYFTSLFHVTAPDFYLPLLPTFAPSLAPRSRQTAAAFAGGNYISLAGYAYRAARTPMPLANLHHPTIVRHGRSSAPTFGSFRHVADLLNAPLAAVNTGTNLLSHKALRALSRRRAWVRRRASGGRSPGRRRSLGRGLLIVTAPLKFSQRCRCGGRGRYFPGPPRSRLA